MRGARPHARALARPLLVASIGLALGCRGAVEPPPEPDLRDMEPQVREQLESARRSVLENGSAENWGALGAAYDAHGLMAEAERCYERATELAPEVFDWTYLLAVIREFRGAELQEVVERFERAAALRPDYAPIYTRLGAALALRGEPARAREAFERAVELDPHNAVAERGLGQAHLSLGELEQAAAAFERAAAIEPRDLATQSGLAQALRRLGQTERANAVAARATGLETISNVDDPVFGERVFMKSVSSTRAFARAQAALHLGEWRQAEGDLDLVLRARPEDASAHYFKGLAHHRLGEGQQAHAALERALELEPTLVAARIELAALLFQEGRFAEVAAQLERAEELQPLDADSNHALALAYAKLGRPAEARARDERAARLAGERQKAALSP